MATQNSSAVPLTQPPSVNYLGWSPPVWGHSPSHLIRSDYTAACGARRGCNAETEMGEGVKLTDEPKVRACKRCRAVQEASAH